MYVPDGIGYEYVGRKVCIKCTGGKRGYAKTIGHVGTIERTSKDEIGVLIPGISNTASSYGVFWFKLYCVAFVGDDISIDIKGGAIMEGNYKIAAVELASEMYGRSYDFALYDDASIGDIVVVNPLNKLTLGTIVGMRENGTVGPKVTKEVVSVVDMSNFRRRKEEREHSAEIEVEKRKIEAELKRRIDKLKDLAFYEEMAKTLGDKDPAISTMVNRLKELGGN